MHGRFIAPDPKAGRNKLRASRSDDFLAGSPGARVVAVSHPGTFTGIVVTE
ncbi:hypothetical protein ABR157_000859 [Enterobacter soli]